MLLEEFDTEKRAVIDPDMVVTPVPGFPETVVSVFSHQLFDSVLDILEHKEIARLHDADGVWPVYEVFYRGKRFGFCKARVGAPACVATFEDVISLGAKRVILTGNCGVLDNRIEDCGIIIPTKAFRDEGTSYHYAPSAESIDVNQKHLHTFCSLLDHLGYSYVTGATWTTDAIYRETPAMVTRRKQMGAICVEMECAAMQAMCNFRNAEFFQFLYAGDNLDNAEWDPRSIFGNVRLDDKVKIALLGFELACAIDA